MAGSWLQILPREEPDLELIVSVGCDFLVHMCLASEASFTICTAKSTVHQSSAACSRSFDASWANVPQKAAERLHVSRVHDFRRPGVSIHLLACRWTIADNDFQRWLRGPV